MKRNDTTLKLVYDKMKALKTRIRVLVQTQSDESVKAALTKLVDFIAELTPNDSRSARKLLKSCESTTADLEKKMLAREKFLDDAKAIDAAAKALVRVEKVFHQYAAVYD